jgi:hypothetical protein
MWIMISGPYRTDANSETERAANAYALNRVAYEVLRKGHVPIVGVNLARPIIDATERDLYERVMMTLCLELASRCDAVLRLDGVSPGADQEVECIRARGGLVFSSVDDIPPGDLRLID